MAAIRIIIFLLLCSLVSFGQADEGYIKNAIDNLRVNTLTPARVGNVLDLINYGKESIVGIYTASGTNTYTVTVGAGITDLSANKRITVKFTNANTSGTVTLNVNGLGAQPLKTNLGADPDVAGIAANSIYLLASTGTTWRIVGPTNEGGVPLTDWGDIAGSLDDQEDLKDTLATRSKRWYKIKTVTSNYTPQIGDEDNKIIVVNNAATFTLPNDANEDFPDGSAIFAVDSIGTASFIKDSGVTVDTVDSRIWIKVGANKYITNRPSVSGNSFPNPLTANLDWDGDGNNFNIFGGDITLESPTGAKLTLDDESGVDAARLSGVQASISSDDLNQIVDIHDDQIEISNLTSDGLYIEATNGSESGSVKFFPVGDATLTSTGTTTVSGDNLDIATAGQIRLSGVVGTTGQQVRVKSGGGWEFFGPRTNVSVTTTYSVAATDLIVHIPSGTFTLTLQTATTYPEYDVIIINNVGSGTITLTSVSTLNGGAFGSLTAGQSIKIYRVGTAFFSYN